MNILDYSENIYPYQENAHPYWTVAEKKPSHASLP